MLTFEIDAFQCKELELRSDTSSSRPWGVDTLDAGINDVIAAVSKAKIVRKFNTKARESGHWGLGMLAKGDADPQIATLDFSLGHEGDDTWIRL